MKENFKDLKKDSKIKGFSRVFKTRMNHDFTLPECLPKIVTLVSMSGFSNDLFETNFSTS